jgi:hypothetical protein
VAFEAGNDEELGRFYVENGFITELEGVPGKALEYIDYKKVGQNQREDENSVFTKNGYVYMAYVLSCFL